VHQDSGGMVSAKGTRTGDWGFQCRDKCGRHHCAAGCSAGGGFGWVAVANRVSDDRIIQRLVGGSVAAVLSPAGTASRCDEGRTGLHTVRLGRGNDEQTSVVSGIAGQGDLGVCDREDDRCCVVVLSVLGRIFFADKFKLDIKGLGLPLVIIYVGADIGSVIGGWASGYLIKRGWPVNKARKLTLLICALSIMPVAFATMSDNKWVAVGLIALAAGGHQAWSANLFTTVSDIFPKKGHCVGGWNRGNGGISGFPRSEFNAGKDP